VYKTVINERYLNWRLYHTTMGALTAADDELVSALLVPVPPSTTPWATVVDYKDNLIGYLWALLYSESTQKTWFSRGNELAIYNTAGLFGGSAVGIGSLSTLGAAAYLNAITIYEGEVVPMTRGLVGYTAPAFASNSAAALIERQRLLKETTTAKEEQF
jgi:hypothetical protein